MLRLIPCQMNNASPSKQYQWICGDLIALSLRNICPKHAELKQHVSFGRKRSRERFELDPGSRGETRSSQLRKELVLDANAVMALPEDQVLCRIERRHVLRA